MELTEFEKQFAESAELKQKAIELVQNSDEGKQLMENYAAIKVGEAQKAGGVAEIEAANKALRDFSGDQNATLSTSLNSILEEARALKKGGASTERQGEIDSLKAQIKDLKAASTGTDHYKKLYETSQGEWTREKKELEDRLSQREADFVAEKINADLQSGHSGLKFNSAIPKQAIDAVIKLKSHELSQNAKVIDGKVIYSNAQGAPMTNERYENITASEIWQRELKDYLQKDTTSATPKNTIVGAVEHSTDGKETPRLILDPSLFSTKVEFQRLAEKTLREKGVVSTSKDFQKAISQAYNEYNVSELATN